MNKAANSEASGNGQRDLHGRHRILLPQLTEVLTDAFGGPVVAGTPTVLTEPGRRHTILRVPLLEHPDGAPGTVVVKRIAPENYHENENPETALQLSLRNETVGLTFLHHVGFDQAPQCYAGYPDGGWVAIEDLGNIEHSCLDATLLTGTADDARNQVIESGRTLGRMHAMTAGRYDDFHALRGDAGALDPEELEGRLGETVGRAQDLVATIDVPLGDGTLQEMQAMVRLASHPGDFRAYTHSDPCAENACVRPDGTVTLLDFEYGSFGHALLDGVYPRMLFPTCWCVRRMPDDVVAAGEAAYREELSRGIPQASDDAVWRREKTLAAGFWVVIAWVFARDRGALYKDIDHGTATVRQRLLARGDAFIRTSEETDELPAFRGVCERMVAEMKTLWPDLPPMDLYPAFGGSPATNENARSSPDGASGPDER